MRPGRLVPAGAIGGVLVGGGWALAYLLPAAEEQPGLMAGLMACSASWPDWPGPSRRASSTAGDWPGWPTSFAAARAAVAGDAGDGPPGARLGGIEHPSGSNSRRWRPATARRVAGIVVMHEKLDGDSDPGALTPRPRSSLSLTSTHFVVGSSRHRMVARLAPNLNLIAATGPLALFLGPARGQNLLAPLLLHLVHPDDAAACERHLLESLREGEGHDITFRVLAPPGTPDRGRTCGWTC